MSEINTHFEEALAVLQKFSTQENFELIQQAGEIMVSAINAGGKIMSCGNGGSMCDAMHFAEELSGRYRDDRKALPAVSISDASHISCVGNDYGYDAIFSRYVEALGQANDVLLAISTSGNSKNVLNAVKSAKDKNIRIVALTGKDGGQLAKEADVNICVSHFGYADRIQEIHIKIIHTLIDYIEQNVGI